MPLKLYFKVVARGRFPERTKRQDKVRLMRFNALFLSASGTISIVIGDLRWRGKTINTEYAESTVVNVLMAMGESR